MIECGVKMNHTENKVIKIGDNENMKVEMKLKKKVLNRWSCSDI